MKKITRKNIEIGVLFGLICAIVLSFSHFEARCDQLRRNVLRLHIIANSDTPADQALKLAVRDEILKNSMDIFKNCDDVTTACSIAETQLQNISGIANSVIKEKGFNYSAVASVGDAYFETREYDGDYGAAVRQGRSLSDANPYSYFVDDENSRNLFLGYASYQKYK